MIRVPTMSHLDRPTLFTSAPAGQRPPANLDAAARDLYDVVKRLVANDGRMTSTDYAKAVAAVRLAESA